MAHVKGAKLFAWTWMLMLWNIGGLLGAWLGYWKVVQDQVASAAAGLSEGTGVVGALLSLQFYEGRVVVITTLLSTLVYKTAYTILSRRQGRRLSVISLLAFPLLNAVGEGFFLLFCFDMGRWYLGNDKVAANVAFWKPAVPALGRAAMTDTFWSEFIMGAIPFALINGLLMLNFWQDLVLPEHAETDNLRHLTSLGLMLQFGYMGVYYLSGDILTYLLLRALSDMLTVLAVRLPPPGSEPERAPKQKSN